MYIECLWVEFILSWTSCIRPDMVYSLGIMSGYLQDLDENWCVVVDSTKNNSTHYVGRMSRDRILRDLGLSWDCKVKERSVVFDLENKLS